MSDNHFRIDPNRRAGRLVCQRLVARSGEAAWIMTMLAALTVSKQRGAAMEQVRGNLERSVANRGRVYEGLKTSTRRIALLCGLPPSGVPSIFFGGSTDHAAHYSQSSCPTSSGSRSLRCGPDRLGPVARDRPAGRGSRRRLGALRCHRAEGHHARIRYRPARVRPLLVRSHRHGQGADRQRRDRSDERSDAAPRDPHARPAAVLPGAPATPRSGTI